MFDSSALLRQRFAALRSTAELFSLRHVKQSHQSLSVRRNVAEPPHFSQDEGAMLSVRVNGVEAYAATADLSQAGLQRALEQAETLARRIKPHSLLDLSGQPAPPSATTTFRPTSTSPCRTWPTVWRCWLPNRPACPRTAAWWTGKPAWASPRSSRPT